MAVFSHNGQNIAYQSEFIPVGFDLLLLHSSQFNLHFWKPILEELRLESAEAGRVITCDWPDASRTQSDVAGNLKSMIDTLGLHDLHVVACGDAVSIAEEAQRLASRPFAKILFFKQNVPSGEDLKRAIREFLQS